jgi:hypothetical protein
MAELETWMILQITLFLVLGNFALFFAMFFLFFLCSLSATAQQSSTFDCFFFFHFLISLAESCPFLLISLLSKL